MIVDTRTGPAISAPSQAAYKLLHFTFVALPILVGLDKFFHILVNWDMYLAPSIGSHAPISPHNVMLLVGVIEIIAGLIVAVMPRFGGYLVAVWLWAVIIDLMLIPGYGYYDIAVRDFFLSLSAIALAELSRGDSPVIHSGGETRPVES